MSNVRKTSCGTMTFHTTLDLNMFKVEGFAPKTERKRSQSEPHIKTKSTRKRTEASSRPKQRPTQRQLSLPSFRQLQALMEAENQQVQEFIKPLLETENSFMKHVEAFLTQWDLSELRRKEVLHKRWADHVWLPLHNRLLEYNLKNRTTEVKRQQMLSRYNLLKFNFKI